MWAGILTLCLSVALSLTKGVSDLIEAFGQLGQTDFRPRLSIVGDGPERTAILSKSRGAWPRTASDFHRDQARLRLGQVCRETSGYGGTVAMGRAIRHRRA